MAPYKDEPITASYFKVMMRKALKEPAARREQQVRSVLGNFGADVGLLLSDAPAILTEGIEYVHHKVRASEDRSLPQAG